MTERVIARLIRPRATTVQRTPNNIVEKINADVNEALRQPQVQDQLKKLSAGIFGGPIDKSSAYMREEIDRWAAVIKSANIELQ
ncbi:tripartite tricarboxylate transporter substrate-binding protein [Bradyrhizobium sp. LMTR 3]|uniref:tripartite tricarboxylate transporter substrate-binding protein n=1 Tax=Bradyrhizobium sp. LMTR 3 TaxID=189873 RepID=UPI001146E293|nr:tripartite tricarboxylate transporter substrate-binding protein [Bradyrhizobium sp. LMTR 3]